MKIAIATDDDRGFDSSVSSRFGRTPYFAIVSLETMEIKVIDNEARNAASGAGVSAAQNLIEEGVNAVISENFGPKAFEALEAGDVKLYSVSGDITVQKALNKLKERSLAELNEHTNSAHSGLK
ncbi:MAG: NifB/NifX family molybdenum-iron cluster-binding protein [Halanaerobiaceae bacterium]